MLENQIKLMLQSLTHNKKTFKTFYKNGFFSNSNGSSSVGEVAIVNNKAVISFLQDPNDESKVIATATFQNGYTLVLKLSGENFSIYRFGRSPSAHEDIGAAVLSRSQSRDSIIADISSIIKHCAEAKEKCSSASFQYKVNRLINSLNSSSEQISQQQVKEMLENTIDKLNKTQNLSKRGDLSPSANSSDISDIPTSTSSISQTPNHYDSPR